MAVTLLCVCAWSGTAAAASVVDARVLGTFSMRARVTAAVNVRGEHAGQVFRRRWVITADGCQGNVCPTLELLRQRSRHLYSRLELHRVGVGRYAGRGAFYAALACKGRIYRHGSRAPYRITLRVVGATEVGGVFFARRITATYVNRRRSDSTPCPLGPSHDAARYRGRVGSLQELAPVAAFAVGVDARNGVASFTNASFAGRDGSQLVSSLWGFGDPGSGLADSSTLQDPVHQFSAPGVYDVTLTETDGDGLSSTATQTVTVPATP